MLNNIFKDLWEWLYALFLNCINFAADTLLGILTTDLAFFEERVPAVLEMYNVFTALGWAILIGNLVFQATKVMMTGLGFEAESPTSLFGRTAVYGFLLLASRQICEIGLGIGASAINLLGMPTSLEITAVDSNLFIGAGDASWVLVIIVGFVLGFQLIKLFFEIGERYVVVALLTLLAPLGFSMGGSKATKDIASGYIRLFASMVVMMILNVVFLKLILSALAFMPTADTVIPWCLLVVALARTARKADSLIARIGLNPAITGDPLTHKGSPMAMLFFAAKTAARGAASKAKASGGNNIKSGSVKNGVSKIGNTSNSHFKSGASNSNSQNTNNQQNAVSNSASNSSVGNSIYNSRARFGSNTQPATNDKTTPNNAGTSTPASNIKQSSNSVSNAANNSKNSSSVSNTQNSSQPHSNKGQSSFGNSASIYSKSNNIANQNSSQSTGVSNSQNSATNQSQANKSSGNSNTVNPVNIHSPMSSSAKNVNAPISNTNQNSKISMSGNQVGSRLQSGNPHGKTRADIKPTQAPTNISTPKSAESKIVKTDSSQGKNIANPTAPSNPIMNSKSHDSAPKGKNSIEPNSVQSGVRPQNSPTAQSGKKSVSAMQNPTVKSKGDTLAQKGKNKSKPNKEPNVSKTQKPITPSGKNSVVNPVISAPKADNKRFGGSENSINSAIAQKGKNITSPAQSKPANPINVKGKDMSGPVVVPKTDEATQTPVDNPNSDMEVNSDGA